jgi:hypothetical protein
MQITLDISEELFTKLGNLDQNLPQVLELGLNELLSRPQEGFAGFAEVLDFLANLPNPEEILALRPSPTLTAAEQQLWQQYEYLEHIIRMAKTKAYLKINASL